MNLDEDSYQAIRQIAFQENCSLGSVLNRLIKKGLSDGTTLPVNRLSRSGRFPVSPGQAGIPLYSELVKKAEDAAEVQGAYAVNEPGAKP